jgi:hypothetical protein
MLKEKLEQFINTNQPFYAIYLLGKNGPTNLEFKKLDKIKDNFQYTNKTLSSEKFYKESLKDIKKGKNDFLKYIHQNIKTKEVIEINKDVKLVITIPSIYWK